MDDPDTADVDESDPDLSSCERVCVHCQRCTMARLYSSKTQFEFTLTVTDDDDPAPGCRIRSSTVKEDEAMGAKKPFGTCPAVDGHLASYTVERRLFDNKGNRAGVESGNEGNILFGVMPDTGQLFMRWSGSSGDMIPRYTRNHDSYALEDPRWSAFCRYTFMSVNDVNERASRSIYSCDVFWHVNEDDPDVLEGAR